MTWAELCEKAKENSFNIVTSEVISPWWSNTWFFKDGRVKHDGTVVATDRTPDQMLAIMEALR